MAMHRRFLSAYEGRFALPQFFNVLLSVAYNKSTLRPGQWAGVVLVFTGLGQQIRLKRQRAGGRGKKE
jgi:EamA domain-containing membrane protein RarD